MALELTNATKTRLSPGDVGGYRAWISEYDSWDSPDPERQTTAVAELPRRPLLSVVALPDGGSPHTATDTIMSVRRQWYPLWEFWLPRPTLPEANDSRFRYLPPEPGESEGHWLDRVVDAATGEYLLPIAPRTLLAPHALFELAAAIANAENADLVYSDEDVMDEAGRRMLPWFKPSWDPEMLLGRNYVGNLGAYRLARLREIGGVDPELERREAYLYDLALRVAATPGSGAAVHVSKVLSTRPIDVLQGRALDPVVARHIVARHLQRRGEPNVMVDPADRTPSWNRVLWPLPTPEPLVSIIVPTRDQPAMLSRCVDGILQRTDYPSIEVLIVDNGSRDAGALASIERLGHDQRVRVIRKDVPFNFSTLNNAAAQEAAGSVIVLLNDDTEVISPGWLRELVSQALRPDIGAVGARLLYPTGRIQHAGIVMEGGAPHHQLRLADAAYPGPSGELALARSVSAVTAACMALRKSVYDEVGGLDEEFAVAFGDVDLCLRIAARGYRLICTPFAELYHHESVSRGYEDTPNKQKRFLRELALLRQRWEPDMAVDRYANPNLLYAWDAEGAWGLPRPPARPTRRSLPGVGSLLASMATRATIRFRALMTPIIPNPLFSSSWYVARYPEVTSYRLGAYRHYRRHGVVDGRDPNPMFDTRWYLARYPDVADSRSNPLDHYLRRGASEGRDPSPRFDTDWYLEHNADVRSSGQNPLLHYLRHGERERRRPRP